MNYCVVVTDGVSVLSDSKNGVIGKLNAKVGRMIPNFQCIIYQEVLFCKVLKINDVLTLLVPC
jgi:hypothetical protein